MFLSLAVPRSCSKVQQLLSKVDGRVTVLSEDGGTATAGSGINDTGSDNAAGSGPAGGGGGRSRVVSAGMTLATAGGGA